MRSNVLNLLALLFRAKKIDLVVEPIMAPSAESEPPTFSPTTTPLTLPTTTPVEAVPISSSMQLLSNVFQKKKSVFLFGGQSNMEGNVDEDIFKNVLKILKSLVRVPEARKVRSISTLLDEVVPDDNHEPAVHEAISTFEAEYLIDLYNQGLIDRKFSQNLTGVDCTFIRPSTEEGLQSFGPNYLSPSAQCGFPFGPDLMFGHTMYSNAESPHHLEPFSIVKVASGGTELEKNWSRENGTYWSTLHSTIHALNPRDEKYEAFVWFQGENDCMEQQNSDAYFDNLTKLVENVRREMKLANKQSSMDPRVIPVVIVQIGWWSDGFEHGPTVLEAQRKFVEEDSNAVMVVTKDLSHFYHFEAAAQLIIGHRIAEALLTII